MLAQGELIVIVCLLLLCAMGLVMMTIMLLLLRPWLQAFMAGVRVSIVDIIGMRLRRIDVQAVLKCAIMATQSGQPVSLVDLQRAYLRGVDLEKITLAHIEAHNRQLGLTFGELVELELKDQLAKKLAE